MEQPHTRSPCQQAGQADGADTPNDLPVRQVTLTFDASTSEDVWLVSPGRSHRDLLADFDVIRAGLRWLDALGPRLDDLLAELDALRESIDTLCESMDRLLAHHHRYRNLLADLDAPSVSEGTSSFRDFNTVMAFADLLLGDQALPDGPLQRVLTLAHKMPGNKLYCDVARGVIAAAVGTLRRAGIKNPEIEAWLDEAITSHGLGFTARNAMRWFFDCVEGKATAAMTEAFNAFSPDETQPLTTTEAQRKMVHALESVRRLTAAPLIQKPRRRG